MDRCSDCGDELHVGDWPFCRGPGSHTPARQQNSQLFDPVVIHRDAAGNIRFPGAVDAPVPAGYQKVELRTINEVRRFEAEVNMRERVKADESLSARERQFSEKQSALRGDLRGAMRHMTPFGQDLARLAMDRNNQRGSKPRDVGFHLDVFSNDSSNREIHSDAKTGWRGRKG
jgi:hypothetical protein